jgi:molybdate transport repressor ModE-like protein
MSTTDRWDALEMRHLRALATVVERGSFAGAARELGYTQSAVSQQIFALERIVGAPVLFRHPGGRKPVELTETGEMVLAHAEPVLARVKAAQADVAALASGDVGRVSLGTFQSFGTRILPGLLARFRALRPRVAIDIRESTLESELLRAVEAGELDLSLAVLPVREMPLEARELLVDPFVLVTRAGERERGLRDLGGRHVLFSCGKEQGLVEALCASEGIQLAGRSRFDDNSMIQALAAAGEGIAVVPRLTVNADDPRVDVHLLSELAPRRLGIVWHRDRRLSAAATEFVDAAAAVCAEIAASDQQS